MSEITDDKVRDFILHELPLVTTLFLKKVLVDDDVALQELYEADDVADMAEKYFCYFQVQPDGFSVNNYYPWQVKSIFVCKTNMQKKPPLTINMFIESARAGRWLYK
ncbi:TPA: DUF1493 family protein [Enterobacter bugandensis]